MAYYLRHIQYIQEALDNQTKFCTSEGGVSVSTSHLTAPRTQTSEGGKEEKKNMVVSFKLKVLCQICYLKLRNRQIRLLVFRPETTDSRVSDIHGWNPRIL